MSLWSWGGRFAEILQSGLRLRNSALIELETTFRSLQLLLDRIEFACSTNRSSISFESPLMSTSN